MRCIEGKHKYCRTHHVSDMLALEMSKRGEILSSILCIERKLITKYKLHIYREHDEEFHLSSSSSFVFSCHLHTFYNTNCAGCDQQVELAYVLLSWQANETVSTLHSDVVIKIDVRTPIVFRCSPSHTIHEEERKNFTLIHLLSRVALRDMECYILYFCVLYNDAEWRMEKKMEMLAKTGLHLIISINAICIKRHITITTPETYLYNREMGERTTGTHNE